MNRAPASMVSILASPGITTAEQSIVVVGSGFGGLGSAIRLQAAGHQVTLLEARDQLGGRAARLRDAGFTWDMGPSLITAPHLLRDLWASAGRDFDIDVPMQQLDPFYRIVFDDGHDTGLYAWSYLQTLHEERDQRWAEYLSALAQKGLSRG